MLTMRKSKQEEAEQVQLFKVNSSSSTYSFFDKEQLVGVVVYQKCKGLYGDYISIGLLETFEKGYGWKIVSTLFNNNTEVQAIVGSYIVQSGAFWKSVGAKNDDGTEIEIDRVLFGDTFILERENFNKYVMAKAIAV